MRSVYAGKRTGRSDLRNPATRRIKDVAWGRFVLGLFVVASLNLAAQPCLMAMEAPSGPVIESAHAAHSEHSSHVLEHDCDHCPLALSDDAACVSIVAADCSSVTDYNFDGRNGTSKLKEIPIFVAIADIAMPFEFAKQTTSLPSADCAALNYPNEPSLNIRFCVFLK